MKKFNRFFVICLTFIFVLALQGCKGGMTYDDLDSVVYENMLKLPEGSYIVVAYQDNCPNCDDLMGTVEKYYNYSMKHEGAMKIYGLDVNLTINQGIVLKKDGTYPADMENAKTYKHVKVKSTPAIFVIESGEVVKVISDFNTEKVVDKAKDYFKELMK